MRRRRWRPWGIVWGGLSPQRVVEGEAGCTRTAIEGTVGSHRRIHRPVTAPHPEVRSRAKSRDGTSEIGFAETGKVARADCCRAKCRCTPSPIRLRGRVGEVEGQSCPVGNQSHESSSQRICGSCRSCEDQAQGGWLRRRHVPTTPKISTSGLAQRCWSCETQTMWEIWSQSFI